MSKNTSAKEIYDIADAIFHSVYPDITELADNVNEKIKKLFIENEIPSFNEVRNEQGNICGRMDSFEKLLIYSRICDLVRGTFDLSLLMRWVFGSEDKDVRDS